MIHRSVWVEEMRALMAAKDSGAKGAKASCRPDYIVRFVEAGSGQELYGEPVDYAPGQEIQRAQGRSQMSPSSKLKRSS